MIVLFPALESDKQSIVHSLEDKLVLVNEQLSASKREKEEIWNESEEKLRWAHIHYN